MQQIDNITQTEEDETVTEILPIMILPLGMLLITIALIFCRDVINTKRLRIEQTRSRERYKIDDTQAEEINVADVTMVQTMNSIKTPPVFE